ncbi:UNKNOWN [Stylonychia lemnae]|uniref:Uncharacterized protein n=1 Tax=Stylonychia lemnae TaxID=5949 RepID=A0A078B8Y4_STYLE|nr:UNKNOWN [Stylonychia lemnae]|eukprot:CDW90955.1 UNKNOWN [Stylonychia lemnae]
MKVKKPHLDHSQFLSSPHNMLSEESQQRQSPLNRSLQQAAMRFNKSGYQADKFPPAHRKTNSFVSQESQQNKTRYIANLNKHMQQSFAVRESRQIPSPQEFRNSFSERGRSLHEIRPSHKVVRSKHSLGVSMNQFEEVQDWIIPMTQIFRASLRQQADTQLKLQKDSNKSHKLDTQTDQNAQSQNKLLTTKELGFAVPSFFQEDQEKFFVRRQINKQKDKMMKMNLSYVGDKVDFTNISGVMQPHLMRRNSGSGSVGRFPNSSQLNFELNLRINGRVDNESANQQQQDMNKTISQKNGSESGNAFKRKKWFYPPQVKEFKKFDDVLFSPRLSDLNNDSRFSAEQVAKIRKYKDKIAQKNQNEIKYLFGQGFWRSNAEWITGLRDSIYQKNVSPKKNEKSNQNTPRGQISSKNKNKDV